MDENWKESFGRMLERRALEEYEAQMKVHLKRGRKRSTFQYSIPKWHRDAVDAMGRDDEEAAKAIMLYRYRRLR